MNVCHSDRDVMNSGATLLQKLADGRILPERLQQLNVGFTSSQHCDAYTLGLYVLSQVNLEAQRVAPNGERFGKRSCRNPYVINLHKTYCELSCEQLIHSRIRISLPTRNLSSQLIQFFRCRIRREGLFYEPLAQ